MNEIIFRILFFSLLLFLLFFYFLLPQFAIHFLLNIFKFMVLFLFDNRAYFYFFQKGFTFLFLTRYIFNKKSIFFRFFFIRCTFSCLKIIIFSFFWFLFYLLFLFLKNLKSLLNFCVLCLITVPRWLAGLSFDIQTWLILRWIIEVDNPNVNFSQAKLEKVIEVLLSIQINWVSIVISVH